LRPLLGNATESRARHTTFAAPGLNRRERFSWMVCRQVVLAKTNDSAQDPTSASAHNRYMSHRGYFAEDNDGWWIASLERPSKRVLDSTKLCTRFKCYEKKSMRPHPDPGIDFVRATRKILLGFMFAMAPVAMAVFLITPGRSYYFAHDEVDTAVLVDLPRDGVALLTPQIAGTVGNTETTDRDGIPCEDVMWSSLKGKCLSFTRRSNHHRRATQAAVYFGGQGR
jgi:hypothetical protein